MSNFNATILNFFEKFDHQISHVIKFCYIFPECSEWENRLPNIKTWANRWYNFSENLRIVTLKLLELTRFLSTNLSIFFNFLLFWGRYDVEISTLTARAKSINRLVYANKYLKLQFIWFSLLHTHIFILALFKQYLYFSQSQQ